MGCDLSISESKVSPVGLWGQLTRQRLLPSSACGGTYPDVSTGLAGEAFSQPSPKLRMLLDNGAAQVHIWRVRGTSTAIKVVWQRARGRRCCFLT